MLELKPENAITLAQLRRIVKNNGFVSKDMTVVARGMPSADQRTFTVSGTINSAVSRTATEDWQNWELKIRAPEKP